MNETILSTMLSRPLKEISNEKILSAVKECHANNVGLISKDEMKEWISIYTNKN